MRSSSCASLPLSAPGKGLGGTLEAPSMNLCPGINLPLESLLTVIGVALSHAFQLRKLSGGLMHLSDQVVIKSWPDYMTLRWLLWRNLECRVTLGSSDEETL